jgi:3-oxoacyl-[acyl-carrier-protein] synthase I
MIAVVRVEANTPVGLTARQTGFILRAGFPAMSESALADEAGEPVTMAYVPTIDARICGTERLCALAKAPFDKVTEPFRTTRTSVHVSLDEGYPGADLACEVVRGSLARILPRATITTDTRGEASLGGWLPMAIRALEARQTDVAIFGGVHSDHDPAAIATLTQSGRLFAPDNLDSRIPGEAAAFFALMRADTASRAGLTPLAYIVGTGAAHERAKPDNEAPAYEAFGMTAAVRSATKPLIDTGRTAGWMLTDLTNEMRRQYEWQAVFMRSQKVLGNPYYIDSPAQRIGYLGAAAMPLMVVMAATAWEYGYAPAPVALAMAGTDGGARAALVLETALKK